MTKNSTLFHCTNCDYRPAKWVGCCPECSEWGSITEKVPTTASLSQRRTGSINLKHLEDIPDTHHTRLLTGIDEWDRVMGGGIVPGSLIIITGDPGIGKSTLLLHVAHTLAAHKKVFYFSSEESLTQVKHRAARLDCMQNPLLFSDQAHVESIIESCLAHRPDLIVIDSIQNCYSNNAQVIPGSIGQLREAAFSFMRLAKENNIAIIITGHITKEGTIAGPKMLEHMVDAVFYLQGEEQWHIRMLRAVKNRFGSINELGFFQMEASGLHQVPNINQQMLNDISHAPGSALISTLEGSRPILLELQALTVPAKFGIPQRIITGIDHKQVTLIAAILEKYLQINLSSHDIFFKVSGNFKIKESSVDLGIALALLSTYFQQPLPEKSLAIAEISLTGAIKPVNHIGIHAQEAAKFGLKNLFLSHNQTYEQPHPLPLHRLKNVYELVGFFGAK